MQPGRPGGMVVQANPSAGKMTVRSANGSLATEFVGKRNWGVPLARIHAPLAELLQTRPKGVHKGTRLKALPLTLLEVIKVQVMDRQKDAISARNAENLNECECKGERAQAAKANARRREEGVRAVRARTARSRYIYRRAQRVEAAR
jgi:hypothetical protein